jgi:hypothetical protein
MLRALAHRQVLWPALLALAPGVHPTASCRSPLAPVQVQPLPQRGMDVLAPRREDRLDPFPGAQHHAVVHAHDASTPVRRHALRLPPLGERDPAGWGPRSCGVAPLRLPPSATGGSPCRAVILEAIGQHKRDTARRSDPNDGMPHALGPPQGAGSAIPDHQPGARGGHRRPPPGGRAREARERLGRAALPVCDGPEPGRQRLERPWLPVPLAEQVARKGPQRLRGLPSPGQSGLGIDRKAPGGGAEASALSPTGQHPDHASHRHPRAGHEGARGLQTGTVTGRPRPLPPWAATGRASGAEVATSQPAPVLTAFMRAARPRGVEDPGAAVGGRHGGRSSRRKRLGRGGIAFTRRTGRPLGAARTGCGLAGACALARRGHGCGWWLRGHDALAGPDGVQHDAEPQASHNCQRRVPMRRHPSRAPSAWGDQRHLTRF